MADLIYLLIPLSIFVHLLLAPYTKVEESFALQATHDILVYGTPVGDGAGPRLAASYDHFAFPGAVPRTFVGSLLLAGVSQGPIFWMLGFHRAQFAVRFVLGMFNAGCLVACARGLRSSFGKETARWWVVMMASQFHVAFYASRTLTNMFAFGLTTLAFTSLLPKKNATATGAYHRLAISLLAFAAIIFRAELSLLLFSVCFYLVVARQSTVWALLPSLAISSLVALLISVPLDSYFWQEPVWPELWAFYFNAVQGKSSDWGTEPWYYYFVNALPRLLLNPLTLLLIPLAVLLPGTRRRTLGLIIPSLLFMAVYSLQPHKETRFIIYVSPPLTAAAAVGANALFLRARKLSKTAQVLLAATLCLSVLASLAASNAMLLLSSLNYPGGDALEFFTSGILPNDARHALSVHTDVLSCMTGVTLFAQNPHGLPRGVPPPAPEVHVYWDKTEDEDLLGREDFWNRFDYVLAEDPSRILGAWEVLAVVDGFAGMEVLRPGMSSTDVEAGKGSDEGPQVGKGLLVSRIREKVRGVTGGWWIGPRMEPRIRILKRKRIVEAVRG